MRKFTYTFALLAFTFSFFSCSKKVHTFHFGTPHHNNTALPEASTTSNEGVVTTAQNEVVTASTEEIQVEEQNVSPIVANRTIENTTNEPKKVDKPNFKQRLATKMITKKIEKIEKMEKGGMNDKMKLGIVIAAVSLVVLIVVAAGLLGGLSTLFWLLGGLGLLTGLIIILLAALDVI